MSGFLRTPGLPAKLPLTVLAVVLFRIGQALPAPGVDVAALRDSAGAAVRDDPLYALAGLFTGGGLFRLSVFGLGVLPYVAALFVVQLLVLTVPRMKALAAEGPAGAARIERHTGLATVAMGALMGTAVAVAAVHGHLPGGGGPAGEGLPAVLSIAACMTAGAAVTAWLIRLITSRGLGEGLAVLFLAQLAAVFPGLLWDVRESEGGGAFAAVTAAVLLSGLLVVPAVLVLDRAERRVPVQFARRMVGVRPPPPPGTTTHVSLRLSHAGLLPVFTALAMLHLPALAARLWPGGGRPDGLWTLPDQGSPWFLLALFALVAVLTVMNSAVAADVVGVTDRLKRDGAFVPGIRPGRPTAEYLGYVQGRLAAVTPLALGAVAVLPSAALVLVGAGELLPVTGTCVLLLVSAALTTRRTVSF
ncbi:preprotein translocase subunit SecY [Actinomadura rugatobispora]|uniref:Preprotein translocase subunit SecY n=1 Tax=Actinomadura rugatobispora TaxID=1994 RepID=A0ABW0ZZ76_9ACTN|nr:preprotein translocase subunit SecY [Actinomadura rugatobispora]